MRRRMRSPAGIDVGRLSQALSRPGIDPRVWVSKAVVTAVFVDPAHGPFADVVLLPDGTQATAALEAAYAGSGFGLYCPVQVDDIVTVKAPSGDPAAGLEIASRHWDAADPPPQGAVDYPQDVLLQVRDGQTLRMVVSGGGKILLGGLESSEPLVLGNVLAQALTELLTQGKIRSPVGPCVGDPDWIQKYLTETTTNILSGKGFTER